MLGKGIPLALTAVLAIAGCGIQQTAEGGNEGVNIKTPLGGLKVKTNEAVVVSEIGLPNYPGATRVKHDKDNGAADLDMSFGDYHLRVKAIAFHTPDPTDKVIAFYRKGLESFGEVIECRGKHAVGTPSRTREGLTCDDGDNNYAMGNGPETVLKAGGKHHQHIVAVEKKSDGTKFGLVLLELPNGKSESN
jgi:hypothetical protein